MYKYIKLFNSEVCIPLLSNGIVHDKCVLMYVQYMHVIALLATYITKNDKYV